MKQTQSIFKQRPHLGKPTKAATFMMNYWSAVYKQNPKAMDINPEKMDKRRMKLNLELKTFVAMWPKWKEFEKQCHVQIINLPVLDCQGMTSIEMYVIRPQSIASDSKGNAAFVWAHGGGVVFYSAELFLHEMQRMAVVTQSVVFSIDYRKGPEAKCPKGQQDFYRSIKFIYENASMLGIDKTKICAAGTSGGSWICLGATYLIVKAQEAHMIKSLFLICPMISDQLALISESEMHYYEVPFASSTKSIYYHLATDEQRQGNDVLIHPGRMELKDLKDFPPTVVFTSEFDYLRRDALHFIEQLKKAGKYLDHQDMPGSQHGYQSAGQVKETDWFFEEIALAMDKYVKGQSLHKL